MKETRRKLGSTQQAVLDALKSHKQWHRGCGWVWTTSYRTEQYMEQLVKLGYAAKTSRGSGAVYSPIEKPPERGEFAQGDVVVLREPQRDSDEHDRPRFTPAGALCTIAEVTRTAGGALQYHVTCSANGMWVILDGGNEVRANIREASAEECALDPETFALRLLVRELRDVFDRKAMPDGSETWTRPSLWVAGSVDIGAYDFAQRVLGDLAGDLVVPPGVCA